MKKSILLLFLITSLLSFKNLESGYFDNRISEADLKFIKEAYNWDSKDFIIIHFRYPKSNCHYNNYKTLDNFSASWETFFTGINLKEVRNVFVYSDKKFAKKIIDSINHYEDFNSFLLKNYFSNEKTCHGVLVINNSGEFKKKEGEYSSKELRKFLRKLK